MSVFSRAIACLLVAFAALPAAASAGGPPKGDPGSTRVVGTEQGVRVTSSTQDDGAFRCISAQGLASICARHTSGEDGPLLVFHEVRAGRILGPLVVAGLAGDNAVRVRVRVRGDVRELKPGRFGAYFAMFSVNARQRDLVVSVRTRSGLTRSTDYRKSNPRWRPVAGSDEVDRMFPGPDGNRLGQLVWRAAGGQLCQAIGDLLRGRVGSLRGRVFNEYPINDGGSCVRLTAEVPFGVNVERAGERVTIGGFARNDVRTLSAQMPDGRTVDLPRSRHGAFGAVLSVPGGLTGAVSLSGTFTNGSPFTQAVGGPPPAG
ncbi:MAG: hypothetical protein JHC95_22450 [Solirubrobacteraceae bacterium]|nr:hypothetical protein [Solirubrobacteraceae bacterium]